MLDQRRRNADAISPPHEGPVKHNSADKARDPIVPVEWESIQTQKES